MAEFRYLIVGGGMTADAACRGIRDHDPGGPIGLVGEEPHPPYARPPLSKALWQGKDEGMVWRGTADLGVELVLGRRVVEIDLDARTAVDDAGEAYRYERLLLATGGRPRRLAGDGRVVYYRTLDDYRRIREAAVEGARFVVIGGGFIGSEIAAALTWSGCAVTMVFPEQGIGARLFPPELADYVTGYYRERGVEVLPGELVEGIEDSTVRLGGGRTIDADGVVAGLGIVPSTELAEAAGPAAVRTCSPPATLRASPRGRSEASSCASSTKTMRTATGTPSARTWPARTRRTRTCRSSTRISSSSATRRSARSTRGSTPWRRGPSRTAKASSVTSTTGAVRLASCSGTSGARSRTRVY